MKRNYISQDEESGQTYPAMTENKIHRTVQEQNADLIIKLQADVDVLLAAAKEAFKYIDNLPLNTTAYGKIPPFYELQTAIQQVER